MRTSVWGLWLSLCLPLAACTASTSSSPGDASSSPPDAATGLPDAHVVTGGPDAAVDQDASMDRDAAAGEDASIDRDAAIGEDASIGQDAAVVSVPDAGAPDAAVTTETMDGGAPAGTPGAPFIMAPFPYHHDWSTLSSSTRNFASYACAPSTNEGGPEVYYRFTLGSAGTFSAHITEDNASGVDVDLHVLSALDAQQCEARAHNTLSVTLMPGTYWLVVDTFVSGGVEQAGMYGLDADFHMVTTGNCATEARELQMVWSSCSAEVPDCYEGPDTGGTTRRWLHTPTQGTVALEAHLVTDDDGFGASWPTSFTDGIDHHYAISQAATGFVMARNQPWAPAGEGGSMFGQGSAARPPLLDEAWYVNMYWRQKPTPGTRMIIRNPANGRAVVASAGWETGPGSNARIGGAVEEIHHHLGTQHGDVMEFGFAADQQLPLGPIICTP